MKTRAVAVAAVAVLTALTITGALAAAAPNPAKALVLQRSDFPAGTIAAGGGGTTTGAGSGYAVTFRYRTGGKPNELTAIVGVSQNEALAVRMFREAVRDLPTAGVKLTKLQLPRYGDEQHASFQGTPGGSRLIVRTGSVVWALLLQTYLTRGGQSHELTKAEAAAELQNYGAKQQRRIGSG